MDAASVCTGVAACEFVQYMRVCVFVCVCCHAENAPHACTLGQLHRTHTPAAVRHSPPRPELQFKLSMETLLCVSFLLLINHSDIQNRVLWFLKTPAAHLNDEEKGHGQRGWIIGRWSDWQVSWRPRPNSKHLMEAEGTQKRAAEREETANS